ncbi:hypothetical protein ACSIGC_01640 [Tenacibaculum sp. ZS6-P6]|uniref:hypothetical protein n=1 Tax=Tenacibaculum sp. ZS6-P6 TaxID=3447503 RepID=UPI003F9DA5AB
MIYRVFLTMLLFCISCSSNDVTHDRKMTNDFIKSLLKNEDFLKVNGILEVSLWSPDLVKENIDFLSNSLKIRDLKHLNFQLSLLDSFRVPSILIKPKRIITINEYKDFTALLELFHKEDYSYLDWLEKKNCKYGFGSISKPIFNEKYDRALIYFEKICGPLCGGGTIALYELEENEWKQKNVIDHWIQ